MSKIYSPEELNSFSKETLVAVILSMQDQLGQLNANMERLIEQIADANNKRYGRSSEKLDVIAGQLELELIFNEAEALTETLYVVEPVEEDVIQVSRRKRKGKREEDLKDLPVEVIPHTLSDEKLQELFGADGWKQLPDPNDDWGEYWFYFGTNGKMVRETEKSIGGTAYIFDHEGRMLTGWVNPSDYTSTGRDDLSSSDTAHLRYYRSGGQQADGWQYLASPDDAEESWYYFRDGRAYSTEYKTTVIGGHYGMAKIKGETYCFDTQGRMVTGMVEVEDGRKFYFNPDNGEMMTGRVVVNDDDHDNEVFYFTTTGSLGNRGDGYTGIKDGALYEEGVLIRAEEGMKYEKVSVSGKDYVVNEQGKVKTSGTVTDADGVKYRITKQSDGTYKIEITD